MKKDTYQKNIAEIIDVEQNNSTENKIVQLIKQEQSIFNDWFLQQYFYPNGY